MSTIEFKNICKRYDGSQNLTINNANIKIEQGEFCVFVGPSGCGKSTLLRMTAGLEDITSGDLLIDGKRANDIAPAKRGLAMVFQSYALYPHMTVRQNMAFGLQVLGADKVAIERKVQAAAEALQLGPLMDRLPKALSGGQRQRVAIGRAIVREPAAFLFDEPLSNLDASLRLQMRIELAQLHRELQATMVYVTHDQIEAMTLADKIVVLRDGLVEQIGAPLEIYRRPANTFVAGFIGSPKMNLITGAEAAKHNAATIGVRPEHIDIGEGGPWTGTVGLSEHLGSDSFLKVAVEGLGTMTVRAPGEVHARHGDRIRLAPAGKIHRFDTNGLAI